MHFDSDFIKFETFELLGYPENYSNVMFILDEVIYWAQKNKFSIIKNNLA